MSPQGRPTGGQPGAATGQPRQWREPAGTAGSQRSRDTEGTPRGNRGDTGGAPFLPAAAHGPEQQHRGGTRERGWDWDRDTARVTLPGGSDNQGPPLRDNRGAPVLSPPPQPGPRYILPASVRSRFFPRARPSPVPVVSPSTPSPVPIFPSPPRSRFLPLQPHPGPGSSPSQPQPGLGCPQPGRSRFSAPAARSVAAPSQSPSPQAHPVPVVASPFRSRLSPP